MCKTSTSSDYSELLGSTRTNPALRRARHDRNPALFDDRFQYDRPLKNIFALQDEIVQSIVTTLKLQLGVQGDIAGKHTDNLEAYDAFLRGLEYFLRFTKEANAQARQMFEKALALDPHYAEACAFLSWTYWMEWALRWSTDPQTLERALALAHQAVALDGSLPRAHSSLSWAYAQKQQYDQALAEGERAIALDPNNGDSYAHHAQTLNYTGRPEEALRAIERAMRLNPRYPPWYSFELGSAYLLTGQYTEAIATLKEASSRHPDFLPASKAWLSATGCSGLLNRAPLARHWTRH